MVSALRLGRAKATLIACLLAAPFASSVMAQSNCKRLPPEDVRLLVVARDTQQVAAALRCRRELLADERVRFALSAAFRRDAFETNRDFLNGLRKAGFRFLVDLRPLLPDNPAANSDTPLGVALREGNLEATQWLLTEVKGGELASYRHLAMPALQPLLGHSSFNPEQQKRQAALLAALAKGLPADADDFRAYQQASFTWWRTQDLIDYRDGSASARNQLAPLPPAVAPVWRELANALGPREAAARAAQDLRVAEMYAGTALADIEYKLDDLKSGLAGATNQPGAMVVDGNGMLATSPGGRVSRESVVELVSKLEARALRLRKLVETQVTGELPQWARPAIAQGQFGELFGLRLGDSFATLVDGRRPPEPCQATASAVLCMRQASPMPWQLEEALGSRINLGGRFPTKSAGAVVPDPLPEGPPESMRGWARLELPESQRRHGLPTFVDVQVRGGRLVAMYLQGNERFLAKEFRRLWGNESSAVTEWVRLSDGSSRLVNAGTVFVPGVGSGNVYQREEIAADDRPLARYRWTSQAGSAEMACAMACNVAIRAAADPSAAKEPRPTQADFFRVPSEAERLVERACTSASDAALATADAMALRFDRVLKNWSLKYLKFTGAAPGCWDREAALRVWQRTMDIPVTGKMSEAVLQSWRAEIDRVMPQWSFEQNEWLRRNAPSPAR